MIVKAKDSHVKTMNYRDFMEVVALVLTNIKFNGFNWILNQISNVGLKTHRAGVVVVGGGGVRG